MYITKVSQIIANTSESEEIQLAALSSMYCESLFG